MQIDLDALERLAKAAGADAGLGTWDATGCVVWFPDGDSVFEAGYSKPKPQYRPVGVAFTNIGAWPDPVDEDAVGEFIAAVCPDAVLALIAKVRELEQDAARWRYLKPRYTGFDFDLMPSSEGAGDGKSVMCFDMGRDFRFSADCERDIDAARGGKE